MRVMVTGGLGRLGQSVLAELAGGGHDVLCVDLHPDHSGAGGVPVIPADLTDTGECYAVMARFRPDAVVHLAAVPAAFVRSETETYRTNAMLAFNVCQVAADLGVGTVAVASSPTLMGYGNPAGWRPAYLPLDEDHPVAPWNAYALSKSVAEEVVRSFAVRDAGRFFAFRPCFVVAPEEWRGAPTQTGHTIAERLAQPELAAVSLFNYLDARDAAEFVRVLLERAETVSSGETFFVGAADALAREPLSELLPKHTSIPAELAAPLDDTAPAFSSAKAERLLGWRARRGWRTEASLPEPTDP